MLNHRLARAKDAALERAMLVLLRPKLARYGQLQQLNLNTSERRLSGVIQLRGEDSPLVISEAHYEIQRQGDASFLTFRGVKTSREWVQNLLEDHLHKFPLKVPDFVLRLLE